MCRGVAGRAVPSIPQLQEEHAKQMAINEAEAQRQKEYLEASKVQAQP